MDNLQTEARNPASMHLDELSAIEIVRLMNREDGRAVEAVAAEAQVIARVIDLIGQRLAAGGRLVYGGAGTSGRLGVLDATECPPTFNSPPGQVVGLIAGGPAALTRAVEGAEDRPELAGQDLDAIGFGPDDVLVGIATSGRTPYVRGAVEHARRRGGVRTALGDGGYPARRDLCLGIDGGGSHTVALLATFPGGDVLGRGQGGPSNLQAVGEGPALRALDDATAAAFAAAGVPHAT